MSTLSPRGTLPHWDMTVVYPALDSPEFEAGFAEVVRLIKELADLFDQHHIEGSPSAPEVTDEGFLSLFELLASRYNEVLLARHTLRSYIYSFVTTDSRNSLAQARESELEQNGVLLSRLSLRFTAWVGTLDVEDLIVRSSLASELAFFLRRTREAARHMMSPAEEALVSELTLAGGSAWGKLHSNVTSQILVELSPLSGSDTTEKVPMSVVRSMATDPKREERKRAYDAELRAWPQAVVPLAAAMNSIKAEVNILSGKRGWASPLDLALFENNIDRQTFEAMLSAARSAFPDFRRYLKAKAYALGISRLAWYDLNAPVGQISKNWLYSEAADFITTHFNAFSPRLGTFAARAFRENWIDAEPRPGKVDGGYCMFLRKDQSRILVNYEPSFNGISTIAHELGHGYHNFNLASRSMLQRNTPMTLAETASIFNETILRHAALANADKDEQIAILESSLQGASLVIVDITSRFLLEQQVFETRRQRELSVEELNQLMLETQKETYGDGLDSEALHPYMWAMKPHYYSTKTSYYNFPYMFGLLFGLGVYSSYQRDPGGFQAKYDDLLSSTGLADAATLATRFGIDTRTPEFWLSSLEVIRADIDLFSKLVGVE